MREHDLKQLLENKELLDSKIEEFLAKKILFKQRQDNEEAQGHLQKAEHNLRFIHENLKLGFLDWSITGCYYACYHAALALIITKGYSSKNHLATLCVIIKEFYKKDLTKEDIEILSNMLDYQDVLFYVESKNRREDATYSTKTRFSKQEVEQLRIKANSFVTKIKNILNER